MKIVYLMAGGGSWGGLEKHVFELADAMAARRHDTFVLAPATYEKYCPSRVKLISFDLNKSRYNPLNWYLLRRKLVALQPDIVHAHAAKAAQMLARSGWPETAYAIGTAHNIKSHYNEYRTLDIAIAVSNQIAAHIPHQDVRVVHNGIFLPPLRSDIVNEKKSWLIGKPRPVVLAIGRLVAAKGFDRLLSSWPQTSGATLVLLGGGPQLAELKGIIQQRRLTHVYLAGESDAVHEWLACADLLIISSRHEGGPYVLAEALLRDVPVLSTRVGMVSDFLPEECLLNADTPETLNAELAQKLKHISSLQAACSTAIEKAKAELTLDAMASATEQIYLSLTQRVKR